jgi:hypothetical protein
MWGVQRKLVILSPFFGIISLHFSEEKSSSLLLSFLYQINFVLQVFLRKKAESKVNGIHRRILLANRELHYAEISILFLRDKQGRPNPNRLLSQQ